MCPLGWCCPHVMCPRLAFLLHAPWWIAKQLTRACLVLCLCHLLAATWRSGCTVAVKWLVTDAVDVHAAYMEALLAKMLGELAALPSPWAARVVQRVPACPGTGATLLLLRDDWVSHSPQSLPRSISPWVILHGQPGDNGNVCRPGQSGEGSWLPSCQSDHDRANYRHAD